MKSAKKLPPTERQTAVLTLIAEHQSRMGLPPTQPWLAERLGCKVGAVRSRLRCLADKGLVRSTGHRLRNIEVVK